MTEMEHLDLREMESTIPLADGMPLGAELPREEQEALLNEHRRLRTTIGVIAGMVVHREDVRPENCLHCLVESAMQKTKRR